MDSGFDFGQSESLTKRLKNLIRGYTRGVGILKEFVQNADDARARTLSVVLDARTHAGTRVPTPAMSAVMGPAILFANDARFSEADLRAIQRLSESSKVESGPKTGRFGLGFNTAYNVTDYPSFVTNGNAYCLDPHERMASPGKRGRGWALDELWANSPDWVRTFVAGGLVEGATDHDGTIFRLPLRTREQASTSEISNMAFTEEDFDAIVAQARELGSGLLLFTRNLERLTIARTDGRRTKEVFAIEAHDLGALDRLRSPFAKALEGEWPKVLDSWIAAKERLADVTETVAWRVSTPEGEGIESWRVISGIGWGGPKKPLLMASRELWAIGEKAVPQVSVAVRIGQGGCEVVPGRFYCGLPLPNPHGQPAHINALFDLDSSRERLTVTGDATGTETATRARWNELLLTTSIPAFWSALLVDLKERPAVYDVFPRVGTTLDPTVAIVYSSLAASSVLPARVGTAVSFFKAEDVRVVPQALREPLAADGYPILEPDPPKHVRAGFGEKLRGLVPKDVRDRFRRPKDGTSFEKVRWTLATAPPPFRRRDWLEVITRFALADGMKEMAGQPVLLDASGELNTIGTFRFFFATETERLLFPAHPQWFVDASVATSAGLVPEPSVNIRTMTAQDVATGLHHVVSKDETRAWVPGKGAVPNNAWLKRVLDYFADADELTDDTCDALLEVPLLPVGTTLYRPNRSPAPLLPGEDTPPALIAALSALDIPVIDADAGVIEALRALAERVPSLVESLTGLVLLPLVGDALDGAPPAPKHADALLDFFSDARWRYDTDEIAQLRALPLFPHTGDKARGPITERTFLPSAFRPPAVELEVVFLKSGTAWRALYERLGVKEMTGTVYLTDVLLPAWDDLDVDEIVVASAWLRDHLSGLVADLGSRGPSVREEVKKLPIVVGPDGDAEVASALHDPDVALIRDVLGPAARFPDAARYKGKRKEWLAFFRELGLIQELTPGAVLDHIDSLLDTPNSDLDGDVERVFEYLKKEWKTAGKAVVRASPKTTLAQALAERAWLPVRHASKRPGFVVPREDRLYRPREVTTDDDLCCSQIPVAVWSIPHDMAVELGIPKPPPPLSVLRHLETVLDLVEDAKGDDAKAVGANIMRLYKHLNRYCEEGAKRKFDHSEQVQVRSLSADASILDPATNTLWEPHRVFSVPVPFFGTLRTHVAIEGANDFLDALGRRGPPTPEDYATFLEDLRVHALDRTLTDLERVSALHALVELTGDGATELPLLTHEGRLIASKEVFWHDAPWLPKTFGVLPLAAADLPVALLQRLRVRRVADHIDEIQLEIKQRVVSEEAFAAHQALEERVRSRRFLAGLLRLVRHDHADPSLDVDLTQVRRLRVGAAAAITIGWTLDGVRLPGEAPAKHFYNADQNIVFLVGDSVERIAKWLVPVICRLCGDYAPTTVSTLLDILKCDESAIDEVLNEDHITAVDAQEVVLPTWETRASAANPYDSEDEGRDDGDAGFDDELQEADEPDRPAPDRHPPRGDVGLPSASAQGREFRDSSPSGAPPVAAGSITSTHGEDEDDEWTDGDAPSRAMPLPNRPPVKLTGFAGLGAAFAEHLSDRPPVAEALPSDALWKDADETTAPSPSQTGTARVRRQGQSTRLTPELLDDGGPPDEIKREVEEAALTAAMNYETAEGRSPRRMPEGNPGYDIESSAADGSVRLIEVKGLSGDWRNSHVTLTPMQLMFAVQHRQRYWVYVVERTAGTPRFHPIQNPAQYIGGFKLRADWAKRSTLAPKATPEVGMRVHEGATDLGTITAINKRGTLLSLTIEKDGASRTVVFKPGEHLLDGES